MLDIAELLQDQYPLFLILSLEASDGYFDQMRDGGRLQAQLVGFRFDPAELLQIIHQALQAVGLQVDLLVSLPTLLAAISDVAHPAWRATSVGVYRLWRDSGYAIGGLLAGLLADSLGIPFAIATIGGINLIVGGHCRCDHVRNETHP